jgi:hypothetical protein
MIDVWDVPILTPLELVTTRCVLLVAFTQRNIIVFTEPTAGAGSVQMVVESPPVPVVRIMETPSLGSVPLFPAPAIVLRLGTKTYFAPAAT